MIFSRKKINNRKFAHELVTFICAEINSNYGNQIGKILEKTITSELIRVHRSNNADEIKFWKTMDERFKTSKNHQEIILEIVTSYVQELSRGYNRIVAICIRWAIALLFSNIKILRKQNSINVFGAIEKIKKLRKNGQIVFVSTHESAMDSMCVGYAIEKALNIHPVYHISQLHIYKTSIVKFFLNTLGVYPIDWKKKNMIYMLTLDFLNVYSILKGRSILFFPDGTLSKDGTLFNKLKTGLIRTTVKAQFHLHKNKETEKVIIVPVVANYSYVREGKRKINRYLTGPQKKKLKKTPLKALYQMLKYKKKAYISFGEPIDVFGNTLNTKGISLDLYGKEVDINSNFGKTREFSNYSNFEKSVTKQLTQSIIGNFYAGNIILSCHTISYAVLYLIQRKHSLSSLEEVAKLEISEYLNKEDICKVLSTIQNQIVALNKKKKISVSPILLKSVEELFLDGVDCLYYAIKEIEVKNETKFFCEDLQILYYYSNRLSGYDIIV